MSKMLLLDIDGVVLRDPLLLEHVKHNCAEYVRAKLPEAKDPYKVNRLLYKRYGHTAHGLRKAFRINANDFDDKVYDKKLMSHLWSCLSSTEFAKDAMTLHEIYESGWDIRLFSNSPLRWSIPVQCAIGDFVGVNKDELFLKPDARAYSMFSTHRLKVFVDDSELNLWPAKHMNNWIGVHFDENAKKSSLFEPNFPTIGSIWELQLFLNSIAQAKA